MDRPSVSPRLLAAIQHDLAQARLDPLPGFDAERALARLESTTACEAKGSRPMARRRPPRVVWLAAAALISAAAAAVLYEPVAPPAPDAAPKPASPVASRPDLAEPPKVAAPADATATGSAVPSVLPTATAPARSGASAARADDTRLERELRQLSRVRQALSADPAGALALADAGHVEFKTGVMREEREALAVMAFSRLSRSGAFEARARRFLKQYPQSAFRERITALLPPSTPANP
jgi:hypothetical protein